MALDVLFIIYDLERGGPEMRLLDFVRYFPQDIRVHICVTSEKLSLLKEFQKYSSRIKVVPIKKSYLEQARIREIRDYIKANRIKIINTFDLKGLVIALFLKRVYGSRVEAVHHTVDLLHTYRLKHKILLWLLLRNIDRSICNSDESRKLLAGRYIGEGKIKVIYNGVDVESFSFDAQKRSAMRKELGLGERDIVLGTVANFRKEKNYPFLFRNFGEISGRHPDLRLLCVGGGPLLEEMKEAAKGLGLSGKVIFTGYTEKVAEHIGAMDIFTLCSLSEGCPNVLIQAMSMGVPVLSTSAGGCKEIIEDSRDGLLFEPSDSAKFLEGLSTFLDNAEAARRLALEARAKVLRMFSLAAMIDNYSRFYNEIDTRRTGN